MPAYVEAALKRFGVVKHRRNTDSPARYVAPIYGHGLNMSSSWSVIHPLYYWCIYVLRQGCGFNYDKMATRQSEATVGLLGDVHHFLQYAATWPSATTVYRASFMQLVMHSDASYLSESHFRSRAGGLCYFSSIHPYR